jgi:hypothetical protein
MTSARKTDWTRAITGWGISLEAVHYFDLSPTSLGNIIYPANPNERNRVLIVDPAPGQPKNIWDKATQHLPVSALFHVAALQLAESKTTLYLANGEKSTMAMWTAGIPNVANTFGEGNRIDDAIQLLKTHQVSHITLIPDCDTHGIRTAYKWQQRGTAAGLTIRVLDLRVYLETQYGMSPAQYHKWDTRDLWLLQEQNKDLFVASLNTLPEVDFSRYADELPKISVIITPRRAERQPHRPRGDDLDFQAIYDDWWFKVVIPQLDKVSPPPSRGKHRTCPNPQHPDKHPSFRLADDGMVFCTCGVQDMEHPRERVAEWVGAIPWEDYKRQAIAEHKAKREALYATPEILHHFPAGIPDRLREVLLRLHRDTPYFNDHAAALVTYELWHEGIFDGQFDPQQTITIEDLQEYAANSGRNTIAKTLRKGMKQLTTLGFFATVGKQPSYRGRPTDLYQAQPLPTAIENLKQKLIYRLRESIFQDEIPDTVTPEWFPDDDPTTAAILADYENYQRLELYQEYHDDRHLAELRYRRRVTELKDTFTVDNLLHWFSSRLDPTHQWLTGRDYRDTFYLAQALKRAKLARNITRRQAADQLGVTENTLAQIRARMGIATDPQFKIVKITTAKNVREQIDRAAPWAKNNEFGRFLQSTTGEERRVSLRDDPAELDEWVARELATEIEPETKAEVSIKIQIGSRERLATEEELEALSARAQRRRERAKSRYQSRRKQTEKSPKPRDPLEEVLPEALAALYVKRQLALIPRDELIVELIRQRGAVPHLPPPREELIPFLPPSYRLLAGREGDEKGNKPLSDTPSDDPDPPPGMPLAP